MLLYANLHSIFSSKAKILSRPIIQAPLQTNNDIRLRPTPLNSGMYTAMQRTGGSFMLDRLKKSLLEAPVFKRGSYNYFIHPITDGVPEIRPDLIREVVSHIVRIADL